MEQTGKLLGLDVVMRTGRISCSMGTPACASCHGFRTGKAAADDGTTGVRFGCAGASFLSQGASAGEAG